MNNREKLSDNKANLDLVIDALDQFHVDHPKLNDFERTFMTGINEKYEQYGEGMFLSDKQAGVLRKIVDKIYGE